MQNGNYFLNKSCPWHVQPLSQLRTGSGWAAIAKEFITVTEGQTVSNVDLTLIRRRLHHWVGDRPRTQTNRLPTTTSVFTTPPVRNLRRRATVRKRIKPVSITSAPHPVGHLSIPVHRKVIRISDRLRNMWMSLKPKLSPLIFSFREG